MNSFAVVIVLLQIHFGFNNENKSPKNTHRAIQD